MVAGSLRNQPCIEEYPSLAELVNSSHELVIQPRKDN